MKSERKYKGFDIYELPLGRSLSSGFFYRIVEVPESWTKRDFDTLEEAKSAIDGLDAPATPKQLAAQIRKGYFSGQEGA